MAEKKQKKKRLFDVSGKIAEKGVQKKFEKQVLAFNEKNAMERVLTLFGSKNKIPRRNISIDEAKPSKGA